MIPTWSKAKAWFRDSVAIFWARIQYVVGIVGAGAALIGAFSGYDFTQLSSMDARSAFKMLAFAALAGVVTEVCRRRTL
jgi:hypothetical protein